MSDMVGVVDAGATLTPGATEKETAGIPQATESVASGTEGKAGDSQESSESGSVNDQEVRQRGHSKMDTIRQLRQERREMRSYWESEMGQLKAQIEELKKGYSTGQNGQKPSKTFWEDPEGTLEEKMSSHLSKLEERMLSKIEQRQTYDQQSSEWRQETSEATKFIQNQKGITPEDEEDIAEIVRSTPAMQNMRPLERAKYAWFLWKDSHGITDKSASKARASTVSGAPPAAGGIKNWTESEIEAEIKKYPPNPKDWSEEDNKRFKLLDAEIKRAYRENRVKKQ